METFFIGICIVECHVDRYLFEIDLIHFISKCAQRICVYKVVQWLVTFNAFISCRDGLFPFKSACFLKIYSVHSLPFCDRLHMVIHFLWFKTLKSWNTFIQFATRDQVFIPRLCKSHNIGSVIIVRCIQLCTHSIIENSEKLPKQVVILSIPGFVINQNLFLSAMPHITHVLHPNSKHECCGQYFLSNVPDAEGVEL